LLLGFVLKRCKLRLCLKLCLFARAGDTSFEIFDALICIIDLGTKLAAEIVKLLAHFHLLGLGNSVKQGPLERFANSPSVEKRIAQLSRLKKDRSGQKPVKSGQKRRRKSSSGSREVQYRPH
jgi:hypothetical protein